MDNKINIPMDDKIIASINNHQESMFSFGLEISGIDQSKIRHSMVKFVIVVSGVEYGFLCDWKADKQYSVIIPPQPHLASTTYPCRIDVVTDGYYLIAISGAITLSEDPIVNVTALSSFPVPQPTKSDIKEQKHVPTPAKVVRSKEDLYAAQVPTKRLSLQDMLEQTTPSKTPKKPTINTSSKEKQLVNTLKNIMNTIKK